MQFYEEITSEICTQTINLSWANVGAERVHKPKGRVDLTNVKMEVNSVSGAEVSTQVCNSCTTCKQAIMCFL